MSDEINPINTVVEKVDPNPPIQTLSKTVVGALLVLSVFINLLQGGCKGWKEVTTYSNTQYQELKTEKLRQEKRADDCTEKYDNLKFGFWQAVDSIATIRANEKLNSYLQLQSGNNSIIITKKK